MKILRGCFILLAIPLVYVLGAGPSAFLWAISEGTHDAVNLLYDPLLHAIKDTPLEEPMGTYQAWWYELGDPNANR